MPAIYGHDSHMQNIKVKGQAVQKQEWKRMTDGRIRLISDDRFTLSANTAGNDTLGILWTGMNSNTSNLLVGGSHQRSSACGFLNPKALWTACSIELPQKLGPHNTR